MSTNRNWLTANGPQKYPKCPIVCYLCQKFILKCLLNFLVMLLPPALTVSQFLILESGWPISNHHLGLNLPNNYKFGSVGKPSPGWNGKSYFSFVKYKKLSLDHFQIMEPSSKIRLLGCVKYLYLTCIYSESAFADHIVWRSYLNFAAPYLSNLYSCWKMKVIMPSGL